MKITIELTNLEDLLELLRVEDAPPAVTPVKFEVILMARPKPTQHLKAIEVLRIYTGHSIKDIEELFDTTPCTVDRSPDILAYTLYQALTDIGCAVKLRNIKT